MDVTKDTTPDWVMNLIRDFQDKITCGLYEAVYSLEGEPLEKLMQGQAHACGAAYIKLYGLPDHLELDDFLARIKHTGPSQISIERDGGVIDWTELHQDGCVCPLIKRNVVPLDQKLCVCGANWVKYLFENVTATPVDVEIIETIATGAENCHFQIRLKAAPPAE